mgnify:CR=1 FL=1
MNPKTKIYIIILNIKFTGGIDMKFLKDLRDDQQVIPLKIMYNNAYNSKDILSIVYKDVNTGKKYVENIEEPEIEIYIVKPEYRGKEVSGKYMTDTIDLKYCETYTCKYKWRKQFAAKILNITPEDVMMSPYVANIDVDIKNWYFIQFVREYYYPGVKIINTGYVDIETDITQTNIIGESPIVCLTYISENAHTVYNYSVYNEKYKGCKEFADNTNKFAEECAEAFSLYGTDWEYDIRVYNDEMSMIYEFWDTVHKADDDFLVAWNAPFDIRSLCERPTVLGLDPFEYVCDDRIGFKEITIHEDNNPNMSRRRHTFNITVLPMVACLMQIYGNIRSGGSRIPSFKLNAIADKELGDKKVDYTEYGNIMQFLYSNFWDFNKYNIKDVFLMVGINHKTKDIQDIYSRMYEYGIQFPDVVSSAKMSPSLLGMKLFNMGKVIANNRNKLNKELDLFQIEYQFDDDDNEEDIAEAMAYIEELQTIVDENGNKKKFKGAIVLNPKRMSSTGYVLNGALSQFLHRFVIDMDITSEYPTAVVIMNMSNDTMVGKLILDNDNVINIPTYDAYEFFKDEDVSSVNKAAIFAETVAQRDFVLAGNLMFDLTDTMEISKILGL